MEDLCLECFTGHLRRKLFQNHKLVDKSTRPKTRPVRQPKPQNTGVECHLHLGETIQSFCHGHSQLCCKVCLTLNHLACQTEEIAKLARNIQDSQELQNIIKKLNTLKKGFEDSLSKTGANESIVQKKHKNAINDMKKLREEFDKLMTETESKADKVKEEDFKKIEKVTATCDIVIPQISKLTTNLETLKEKGATERLFVSMKHAESQLKLLEENLEKIEKENTVREYTFEPDVSLKALFEELTELGQFLFEKPDARIPLQIKVISPSDQKKKRPIHLKDINVTSTSDINFTINDSLVLPNKQILISDWENSKLKLIDTNQDKIMSELTLSRKPIGLTKMKDNEVAVIIELVPSNKIQFVSLCQNSLALGSSRDISLNGICRGIAYNDKDQTLVVAYCSPAKVEILNRAGTVIKCFNNFFKRNNLRDVALSPTMTEMFVTDSYNNSVINLTMNGDVKAVYKDEYLRGPAGICVHKSGIVYVVGNDSGTVHQLDPNSGDFKLLSKQKDEINRSWSISYCEFEDKLYIGLRDRSTLKVFQMK